jgi:hypothetical protein
MYAYLVVARKGRLFLLSLLLTFSACAGKPGTAGSPADAEAREQAEKFWFSQITRCGDSYYRVREFKSGGKEFFEIKDPKVRLAPRKVTDADRLNGVEWDGKAVLEAKAVRAWGPTLGHWEAWGNGVWRMSDYQYPMKKVNGQWSVDTRLGGVFDEVAHYAPADCSKIPPQ